jgi:hypothetical protein
MSEDKVWFDINSIVNLQKQLITNLSGKNDPDAQRVINNVAGNLNALDDKVKDSSVLPTLTYQNEVNGILEREKTRLDERKQVIDNAELSQKRLVDLTNSATLRNKAFNKMYVVITIALIVYLGIALLTGFVPSIVTDIMIILLVSVTAIILINMYSDYSRRSNMDYNMISLGEPGQLGANSASASASASANLLDARFNGCVKEACCPEGSTFNDKYSICVPNTPPFDAPGINNENYPKYKFFVASKKWMNSDTECGATKYSLLDLSCNAVEKFTNMAAPNSPSEFVNYNLYK